ncbi:MAG TPA: hypothetical protein VHW44_12105 [Pseudonocardiaceae bacterium]|jgi:hypothetical protein|nr:hypothetical protein [Pseudonocardiaceae bacterium]
MDYRSLFGRLHQRPQMYGIDGSYGQFCAFLHGVDAGNDGQLLVGFRESLVVQVGTGDNLNWPSLLLHVSFPGVNGGFGAILVEPANEQLAVDTLFSLLDEFLERRTGSRALAEIFDEYLTWLRAQSWYRPPS